MRTQVFRALASLKKWIIAGSGLAITDAICLNAEDGAPPRLRNSKNSMTWARMPFRAGFWRSAFWQLHARVLRLRHAYVGDYESEATDEDS